jgi:glycosyltransferase involved in cell wall biosynthesis
MESSQGGTGNRKGKVVFCTPSLFGPTAPYIKALEDSLPLVEAAGWEHGYAQQIACPYISAARANMLRAALDSKADVIVFIDYDMSWEPQDLLTLIETEGDVVAGTYRTKIDEEHYMGTLETDAQNRPIRRESDGALRAKLIPAGFLKVTRNAVDAFMVAYPDLCYGPMYNLSVDLFNHGVHERIWWGEDYSFARRYREKCGDIWVVPNINLDHNTKDKVYRGNLHEFLMRQPGGSKHAEDAAP